MVVTMRAAGLVLLLTAGLASVSMGAPEAEVYAGAPGLEFAHGLMVLDGVPFTGVVTDAGDALRTSKRTAYVEGLRHGTSQSWHPNGQLAFEGFYEGGREHGVQRSWYADGQLKQERTFAQGLLEGIARDWFPDGTPYREATYAQGQEEGAQRMWYTDGSLRANYVVRDGRRYGLIGSKACVEEAES